MAIQKTSRDLMIENNKLIKELAKTPPVSIEGIIEAIEKSKVSFEKFIEYQDELTMLRADLRQLKKALRLEMALKENKVISYAKWVLVLFNTGLLLWLLLRTVQ